MRLYLTVLCWQIHYRGSNAYQTGWVLLTLSATTGCCIATLPRIFGKLKQPDTECTLARRDNIEPTSLPISCIKWKLRVLGSLQRGDRSNSLPCRFDPIWVLCGNTRSLFLSGQILLIRIDMRYEITIKAMKVVWYYICGSDGTEWCLLTSDVQVPASWRQNRMVE